MDHVPEFVVDRASADVLDALKWLLEAGFTITYADGRNAGFGNICLRFEHEDVHVEVVRDRGQWSLSLAADGVPDTSLNVLLAAQGRYRFGWFRHEDGEHALPEQLPPGVLWSVEVPATIEWIRSADRKQEIDSANQAGRRAMAEHFSEIAPERRDST